MYLHSFGSRPSVKLARRSLPSNTKLKATSSPISLINGNCFDGARSRFRKHAKCAIGTIPPFPLLYKNGSIFALMVSSTSFQLFLFIALRVKWNNSPPPKKKKCKFKVSYVFVPFVSKKLHFSKKRRHTTILHFLRGRIFLKSITYIVFKKCYNDLSCN